MEFDEIPLTQDLTDALRAHQRAHQCPWVFPNPSTGEPYVERNKWMPRLCEAAGVRPFGLHGIRYLTASLLVAAGVPLVDVQAILRHKKLTTTARYVHQLQPLRRSISILEGRGTTKKKGNPGRILRLVANGR